MADIEDQPRQQVEEQQMSLLVLKFQGEDIPIELTDEHRQLLNQESPWLTGVTAANGDVHVSEEVFARPVEDVERYWLKQDGNWWALHNPDGGTIPPLTNETDLGGFFDALDIKLATLPRGPAIAVLLESPHKQEYDDQFKPLGPARGPTGESFHRYFTSHVLPMLDRAGLTLDGGSEGFHVFLVNPVPYQASLRHLLTKGSESLKNKVWKRLWVRCKAEFMERLQWYEPKIILNGCTAEVKPLVADAVKEHERKHGPVQHYNVAHPSQWQLSLPPFGKALPG